jgi:hypothetical protein
VVLPQELPEDAQGPLTMRPGPRQVPQVLEHGPQVVHVDGHLGMVGPVSRLVDDQGPLMGLMGLLNLRPLLLN